MDCYLCKNKKFVSRAGSVRDNPSIDILECSNCGLVSLSSVEHIENNHYEQSGMHGDELPSIECWLKEARLDDERRYEMLKSSMVNKKILDFGCGAGGFIRKAQSLAGEIAGVELEQRVHDYWGDKITLFNSLEKTDTDYDLITAFHVVEHLIDPRKILRELSNKLEKNGCLVIEVPSSQDALLTMYGNNAFQKFTYWSQHLYLFDVKTLNSLADQVGLEVISIQQYQRYPLSNHLYWLSKNQPGGHQHWSFLDSVTLNEAYAAELAKVGKCDTLIAYLAKK